MELEELLGDAYKEGMTFDEVKAALSGKKLADLSTGKYVNKEMANKEKTDLENNLNQQISDLQEQLNNKLTDDEKNAKAVEAKDKKIEELLDIIRKNSISSNKSKLMLATAEMRAKLGIEDNDTDFNSFVDLITLEDDKNSSIVTNYISTLLKNAYEKGVADTTKEQVGDNSSLHSGGTNKDDDNIGARLAKKNKEAYEKQAKAQSSFF